MRNDFILKNLVISVAAISMLSGCSQANDTDTVKKNVNKTQGRTHQTAPFDYTSNWLNIRVIGLETADAPNMILIPGLVSSSKSWDRVTDTLAKTYRLHMVDVSGFAGTPSPNENSENIVAALADELSAYIETEKLKHVTIMGHSMGGFTALKTAENIGEALDKIVIVDALPFYPALFNPNVTTETSTPRATQMRTQIMTMKDDAFETMQAQSVSRMSKDTQTQKDILKWSVRSNRNVMANAMYNIMTQDMRESLKNIATPVHVIYAWDAAMGISVDQMKNTYEGQYTGLENAQFTRIDNSYHFIMRDQPEAFLTAVQVKNRDEK
ncbi:MAG: hypothetical protein COA43_02190 [Robiginitomaculum sp.]|nr:MAG: hypothetical protein COA43_02190 [Robiginitomaculum sp.]